jgi:hypothetical protein
MPTPVTSALSVDPAGEFPVPRWRCAQPLRLRQTADVARSRPRSVRWPSAGSWRRRACAAERQSRFRDDVCSLSASSFRISGSARRSICTRPREASLLSERLFTATTQLPEMPYDIAPMKPAPPITRSNASVFVQAASVDVRLIPAQLQMRFFAAWQATIMAPAHCSPAAECSSPERLPP